jgi:hypothetical protein
VAIDNRTNPGKTSPSQGLVRHQREKSTAEKTESPVPAFLPKGHSARLLSFTPFSSLSIFGCCQLNTRFYQGIDLSFRSLLVSLKPNKPYCFFRTQRAPHDTAIRLEIELQVGSPVILSRSPHPQSLDCFLRFSYTILAHTAVP